MHIPYKTCLLSCLLSAALLGGCAKTAAPADPEDTSVPETEASAPAEETDLPVVPSFDAAAIDGSTVSSSIFADSRLTMVNVWATYCNPCLNEMPDLGELAGAYDSADFQIIGVISDVMEDADEQTLKKASGLIEQTGAAYPHLLLGESLYTALLTDVTAVPTTFFIDSEGQILDTVIGARDRDAWEETINALLEE